LQQWTNDIFKTQALICKICALLAIGQYVHYLQLDNMCTTCNWTICALLAIGQYVHYLQLDNMCTTCNWTIPSFLWNWISNP